MNAKSTVVGAALAAAMGVSSVVSAGATYTNWQSVDWSQGGLTFNQTLNFSGFNSALGTLLGVEFQLSLNETLNNFVVNNTSGTISVGDPIELTAQASMTATGMGSATFFSNTQMLATPGYTNSALETGTTTVGTASIGNYVVTGSSTSNLSSYSGASTVTVTLNSIAFQSGSLPSEYGTSVSAGVNGSANGIGSLRYLYSETTVPEPATLSLLGIGLLGGFAANRRRKTTTA